MPTSEDYKGQVPAWCPGCGNFQILSTIKQALVELGIEPWEVLVVSGIGQAGKLPHYIKCHTFNGLHGRTLPVATAAKLANHSLHVIAVAGDGDCYGEGGNHFLHAIRRNPNISLFVHNNQIYGLTKGQASPTTAEGTTYKNPALWCPFRANEPACSGNFPGLQFCSPGFCRRPGVPERTYEGCHNTQRLCSS